MESFYLLRVDRLTAAHTVFLSLFACTKILNLKF